MFTLSQPTTGYCTPTHPPSIAGSREVLDCRCHKILGPPLEWGPMGPHIINIMAPHWDFRAPFELALLARREVAFGTVTHAITSNLPSKRNKGRTVFLLKNFNRKCHHGGKMEAIGCAFDDKHPRSWDWRLKIQFQRYPQLP